MPLRQERISPAMGVRVGGIDLHAANNDLNDLVGELRQLLLVHNLLVITNQNLNQENMKVFGEFWGELHTHPSSEKKSNPHVQVLAGTGEAKGRYLGSWHSDMTWHPTPPWITMLHARKLPQFGGGTGFANQHLAWETLDQTIRDTRRVHRRYLRNADSLRDLRANHTGKGFGPNVPDSVHHVVRTHDETSREALYVNPEFISHIVGVTEAESVSILFPIWLHALTQEFCYRHHRLPGDLVIWDNRSVMHTAILDYKEPRTMTRVLVKGGVPV